MRVCCYKGSSLKVGIPERSPLVSSLRLIQRLLAQTRTFAEGRLLYLRYARYNGSSFGKAHASIRFSSLVAVVAQLVEHFHGKEEVTGSIPVNGSIKKHPQ